MTIKNTVRFAEVLAVALLVLFGTVLAADMRVARAQSVPLGTRIVCFVYHGLNNFGSPIPLLTDPDCAATSTPSGGGDLTVIKDVSGGTATASDFEIHVLSAGTDISGSPQPGSSSGTSYIGIAPGNYVVSESGASASQYSAAFSGNCSGGGAVMVFASSTAICTITNTFNGTTTSGGGTNSLTGTLTGTVTSGGTVGTTSSSTGTLSGTVGVGGTLTGTVTNPSGGTLTGTVVSSSGGGGGGGGGGNGPIAGSLGSGGGGGGGPLATTGGGSPAGQVLGASTGPSIPGVPNTGAGGNVLWNLITLALSAMIACGAFAYLRRHQQ